jgi:CheY-like chemotaxis protein
VKRNPNTPFEMDPPLGETFRQEPFWKQNESGAHPNRCLVVDDDPTVIEYVARLLEKVGFAEVETAQRRPDVMNKLDSGPYQLLITDLEMPDMNGYQLTQTVKRDAHDTKTIIMTGRHESDCLEMMASRWVDGWLFKPFGWKEMRAMLSSLGLLAG